MLDFSRHGDLFNPYNFNSEGNKITIIGVGATGSWLALMLAKIGVKDITVYDFDTVEEHNIANQAFSMKDIGRPKVDALKDLIMENTGIEIKAINEKFTNQRLFGYVFLMVDSMKERKRIWEEAIKFKTQIIHLIEPRMGISLGRIYNINPTNIKQISKYEETFYSDDNAEVSACGTSLTVVSTSVVIAGWCLRQLINHYGKKVNLSNEILIDVEWNNIIIEGWE